MTLLSLILVGAGAFAADGAGGALVERQRMVSSEALAVGECEPMGGWIPRAVGAVTAPSFVIAISERVQMESYMVSVAQAGWLQTGSEEIVPNTTRPFDLLETYTRKFVGPNAATECRLFAAALRENPSFRFNAGVPTKNREHVGYR